MGMIDTECEGGILIALEDHLKDTLGDRAFIEDTDNDGYTGIYLSVDGKRFKIMVQECGDDV